MIARMLAALPLADIAPDPGGAGARAGKLGPFEVYLDARPGAWLLLASLLVSLTYGVWFYRRPHGRLRTVVKTAPVALLELVCLVWGAPWPLHVALIFSALGDAFLASGTLARFRMGLGAFLLAHLAYVALFITSPLDGNGHVRGLAIGLPPADHLVLMAAAALVAAATLRWLWPRLGALRWPVTAYVMVILAMVVTSLTMPAGYGSAVGGAFCFFASDAILAAQTFRNRLDNWLGRAAVWWLYYVAQVAIMWAFVWPLTF